MIHICKYPIFFLLCFFTLLSTKAQVSQSSSVSDADLNKYVVGSTFQQIRRLRVPDTSYVFRVNIGGVIGDYKYDPTDVSTADDTVMTLVSSSGYRYKRYVADGIYDPYWWGAKGDGVADDTGPIRSCLLAIKKYNGNRGASMRLSGQFKFNPTKFQYPQRTMTIFITGRLFPQDTWVLPFGISLQGLGGDNTIAQFGEGPMAELIFNLPGTTRKPAIELQGGGQIIKSISIESFEGIGIRLQGIGGYAAALSTLDNVAVSAHDFPGEQIGIEVLDWFWAKFHRCAATVEQGPNGTKPGSSVKIVGKSSPSNTQLSYLLTFDQLITQSRPVRIQAGSGADNSINVPIFNVQFNNCVFENLQYDTACVVLNGNNIGIQNVAFNMCSTADCPVGTYLLKNIGSHTSGVTINQPFDQYLVTGDPIRGLVVNNASIASPFVGPIGMNDMYTSSGHYNGVNSNRGWKGVLDMVKADGGQVSPSASEFARFITSASAPYVGPGSDTNAVKLYPHPAMYRDIVFKTYVDQFHTGDKFVFGCWVKMEDVKIGGGCSMHAFFDYGSKYKFKETNTFEFDDISFPQIAKDWVFMTALVTINSKDANGREVLRLGMRMKQKGDTAYIARPFAYKIDASANVSEEDALAWAKETLGGGYNIPRGTQYLNTETPVMLRDDSRIYKGNFEKLNKSGDWVAAGSGATTGGSQPGSAQATSGTYTPVSTTVSNISGAKVYRCQWMRVGNVVTVSGKIDIDPLAAGAAVLAISLPCAAAVGNDFEAGGTAACGLAGLNGSIKADAANDRAQLDFVVPAGGSLLNNSWYFTFTYYIAAP